MANNPYVNKVIYGNNTVMDISDTTATESDVISGKTFYKANGAKGTGTATTNYYSPDDATSTDIDDADYIPFYDNSASAKKNSLWSNIKAKLNEIFFRRSEANILGAKNLLPLTSTSSGGNITWTIADDGTIIANGASGDTRSQFAIDIPSNLAGNFYISGCPSGGSASKYDVYVWDDTTGARVKKWDGITASESDYGGTSQEIQIPSGHTIKVNCRIVAGNTVSNLVFRPMIRLSTDTDDTFEPFAMTNKALTDKFGTLGSASTKDVPASGDAGQTEVVLGSDTRLTDARTPTSHTHTTTDITDFPTLATVATSGSYNDLSNTPTIPDELADLSDDATHRLVTDTEMSTWNDKCDSSVIAPVENGTTASQAYGKGEHFIKDGAFCTVIADISSGAALTLDTNYKAGQIDATSLLAGKILTSNDNLDNIKDFGIYSWGVSYPTNSPINGSAAMLVIRYATAGVHQIVYTPYLTCIRIYSGGEWTTFRKAVTYDSVSSGTLTMKSGITGTIGNAACYKKNGMVCVGGRITGASTSADKAIVNVPSGFRPLQKTWGMNCAYDTTTGKYVFGSVAVDTNGDIIYYITTNNCSTFYFQFTYPVD